MKKCDCWYRTDNQLRMEGFKISDACSGFQVEEKLSLRAVFLLPLQRVDGKRLKRNDPKTVQMSHCPFCGTKL